MRRLRAPRRPAAPRRAEQIVEPAPDDDHRSPRSAAGRPEEARSPAASSPRPLAMRSAPASCPYPSATCAIRCAPPPTGHEHAVVTDQLVAPGVKLRGYTPKEAATHGREPGRCGTTCGRPRCSPQIHTISPLPEPDQGRVRSEPTRLGNGSSRRTAVARRRGALQQARLSRRPCDAASGGPEQSGRGARGTH